VCVCVCVFQGDALPAALVELVRNSPISSIEDLQLLLLSDSVGKEQSFLILPLTLLSERGLRIGNDVPDLTSPTATVSVTNLERKHAFFF